MNDLSPRSDQAVDMATVSERTPAPADKASGQRTAKEWLVVLSRYRDPDQARSLFELVITFVPFVAFWAAAWWALAISYWLALVLTIPAGVFLVRLFLIQHDCGHGAFFRKRGVNDWLGRALGVLTMTPYDVWRRSHMIHHGSHGNLEKRGVGDVMTLTVREFEQKSFWGRFGYRFYRHPMVMFVLGPVYVFLFHHRLPIGFMRDGWRYWISAMGTNVAILLLASVMIHFMGLWSFLGIYLPVVIVAAMIGVWLFYVQHQFEEAVWDWPEDWQLHEAALYGSTHYDLPRVVRWLTANIGIHHVHHLYSRIPFYRLGKVLRDHPALADIHRVTFLKSFGCMNLQLWDEQRRRLVSFADARRGRQAV